MKNSQENLQKRRDEIINYLSENTELSVEQLSEYLNVSVSTIRRDLSLMEEMGLVKRFHGGASIRNFSIHSNEPPQIIKLRHLIAKRAAQYINNYDVIFFNSSQTALYSMHYLGDLKTTIITNNVNAIYLKPDENTTLILTGGEIRYPKESMVGDIANNTISNVTSTICIMGCNGIDPEFGITTEILHEAKVNNLFFENTLGYRIVVADYRKIGHRSNFKSGESTQCDILVTDIYANQKVLSELEKQGITVIQVDPRD